MKILTIFKKNLKTVSRNWNYFILLFICPIILIFVAGMLINSSGSDNIHIGFVDQDPNYDINLNQVKNQVFSLLLKVKTPTRGPAAMHVSNLKRCAICFSATSITLFRAGRAH